MRNIRIILLLMYRNGNDISLTIALLDFRRFFRNICWKNVAIRNGCLSGRVAVQIAYKAFKKNLCRAFQRFNKQPDFKLAPMHCMQMHIGASNKEIGL